MPKEALVHLHTQLSTLADSSPVARNKEEYRKVSDVMEIIERIVAKMPKTPKEPKVQPGVQHVVNAGPKEQFEVRNNEREAVLVDAMKALAGSVPQTFGYVTLLFKYGDPNSTFYVSTEDGLITKAILHEFVQRFNP